MINVIVRSVSDFFFTHQQPHSTAVSGRISGIRDMRSSSSCSACLLRSGQFFWQDSARLYTSALSVARVRSRQISSQTHQPQHTSTAAYTNAKTGQKYGHASVATSKTHQTSPSISEKARATSLDTTRNVPHPENDLSSTRPARLNVPEGPAKAQDGSISLKTRGSYLIQLGKAYAGFYKTGVKNIWYNYKEYRSLLRRFSGTDIHDQVKYEPTPKISRREFQLYLRTRHDLRKLIPFGLVFIACGEFTPLVVLALGTAVVPYSCRIPKQIKKDLEKTLSRIENVERITSQRKGAVGITPALAYVHGLDPFGLAIRETPVLSALLRRFWVEPKFKQRMDDIICDAILIMKEGGVERLEPAELFQFCVNIREVDTIKRLIDYYTLGIESRIPDPEAKRTQKEVQVFIDGIREIMASQEKNTALPQPESIFVAASKYARSLGEEGPYIPPPSRVVEDK